MKLLVTATLAMAATFSTLSAAEDCGSGCKKKENCKKTEISMTSSSSEDGGCSGSGCKKK